MIRLSISIVAIALLTALVAPCARAAGPYIYVGNTGEDTVSKIDAGTNTEVARIATWFTSGSPNFVAPRAHPQTQAGPCPSRIAKDPAGFVYVLDRFFPSGTPSTPNAHLPVLLKIAPTAVGPIVPMLDNNPTNNHIDPPEITDARVLWAKEIGTPGTDEGALGRALCMDTTGNLWVGMYNRQQYYKVNPATGAMIGGPVNTPGHTPYGCQVDVNGKLWSVDEKNSLAEFDTTASAPVATVRSHPGLNYSLSLFNDCSSTPPKIKVYLSDRSGQTYIAFDAQTSTFSYPPPAAVPKFVSYSVAVDSKGNVISGAFATGEVIKVSPSGTLLWDTNTAGPTQPTTNLHGLIIDDNDDVWAVHLANDRVVKYSGANGTYIATVPVGVMPYTYGNTPPATCTGTPTPTPTPTSTPTPTPTPGCAQVTGEARCLPNGGYSYTFTVTNNSGSDMSQILLTPLAGSTFTLSPQLFNLSSPLHNGQSTTVTTNIGNAKPGDKVCFFVSLMSDKAACCIVQVCPTLPSCGVIETGTPPPPRQLPRGKRRP
jgi:YVTN family beta-propeller protein